MVLSQLQAIASGTLRAHRSPGLERFCPDQAAAGYWRAELLVPYVQTAAEAQAAVAATRYPPEGIRGVAVLHRANLFGRIKDYYARSNREICLLLQIETRQGLTISRRLRRWTGWTVCSLGRAI